MLDFSNLRTLNVNVEDPSDLAVTHALIKVTEKLEIEEISLEAHIHTDGQYKIGDEWGGLDSALAKGFPKLYQVSLHIFAAIFSSYSNGIALEEKLNKLPEEQCPRLSENAIVMFDFLTEVEVL